jgi:hypothetical protein
MSITTSGLDQAKFWYPQVSFLDSFIYFHSTYAHSTRRSALCMVLMSHIKYESWYDSLHFYSQIFGTAFIPRYWN